MSGQFVKAFVQGRRFLMEGSLGERLKREYGLNPDPDVGLAVHGVTDGGQAALPVLWREYAGISRALARTELPYLLPFTIQRNGTLIHGRQIARFLQEREAQ